MNEIVKKYLTRYYTLVPSSSVSYLLVEFGTKDYIRPDNIRYDLRKIFSLNNEEVEKIFVEWIEEAKIKKKNEGTNNKYADLMYKYHEQTRTGK